MGGYNPGTSPSCDTTFTEMYANGVPGAPVGKQLTVTRAGGSGPISFNLAASYTYDPEGRVTTENYPTDYYGNTSSLGYTFDSMGRLNTMTDNIAMRPIVGGATYGPANELTSISGGSTRYNGESRTYNSLKQLTSISTINTQYNYPATNNNGKISSQTDLASGETVTYTYALNRLATANNSGATPTWGQAFSYDGFGNLTQTSVTQGSAPTMTASYDVNNHQGGEDANGNPGYVPVPAVGGSAPGTYDVENRLTVVSGVMDYSYDPANHRVWRGTSSGGTTDEVTFWSISGRKLATYQITQTLGVGPPSPSQPAFYCTQTGINYYFGGKLIEANNAPRSGWVYSDRLGSIGKFYPYGIERPSATGNGTEKFTGYFRDAESGNDYAVNRYESPGTGRFLTTDPLASSAKAEDPGSWNRYAYVEGDPANRTDPNGADLLCVADPGDPDCNGSIADYCENLLQAAQAGDPVAAALFGVYCPAFSTGGGGSPGGSGPSGSPNGGMGFAASPPTLNGAPSWVQTLFNNAWGAVAQLLNNLQSTKCDQAIGDTGSDLQAKLSDAVWNWAVCPNNAAACTNPPGSPNNVNTVDINPNDNYGRIGNTSFPFGGVALSSASLTPDVYREFLILHELAHLDGDTGLDDKRNYDTPLNRRILTDCLGVVFR